MGRIAFPNTIDAMEMGVKFGEVFSPFLLPLVNHMGEQTDVPYVFLSGAIPKESPKPL